MQFWISAETAKSYGCTHRARMHGVIPGFWSDDGLWVSRSDLLNPFEDLLSWVWVNLRLMRGEDPDFMIMKGRQI